MIKVYIGTRIPKLPVTEILYPNLGNGEVENPFGEKVFADVVHPFVEIVSTPEDADYLCLPHNYNYLKHNPEYLKDSVAVAEKFSKKILVFFPGDSDEEVSIPHTIVFRNSQYGYQKRDNEVILPGYAVDLGQKYGIESREKSTLPTIGFCGWAHYGSFRQHASIFIKDFFQFQTIRKSGLSFRIKALKILQKSSRIVPNFIIRSSYSGHSKTIDIDPQTARFEYVENMKTSDIVLAPKGDGNFSVRFYEALSLGRIPLLVDTDCLLPLPDEIDYTTCILRVDHRELHKLPEIITDFYAKLSSEEFATKQKMCRVIFEKYLRIDRFFARVMQPDFLRKFQ